MNSFNPLAQNSAVNGLITAISRNTEDGVLSRHLGAQSWYIVADYLHPHAYERGHLLISQGAKDRNLYFLESGNLKVDVTTDSGLVQLAILDVLFVAVSMKNFEGIKPRLDQVKRSLVDKRY